MLFNGQNEMAWTEAGIPTWSDQEFDARVDEYIAHYHVQPSIGRWSSRLDWVLEELARVGMYVNPFWFNHTPIQTYIMNKDSARIRNTIKQWRDVHWLSVQACHIVQGHPRISSGTMNELETRGMKVMILRAVDGNVVSSN